MERYGMESVDILVYFGQYFPTARSWVSRIKKKIPIWIFNIYIGSACRSKGLFPPVFAFCSLLATSGHCQSSCTQNTPNSLHPLPKKQGSNNPKIKGSYQEGKLLNKNHI